VFSFWSSARLYWRKYFFHLTHAVLIQPYHFMIISGVSGDAPFVSQGKEIFIRKLRPISILNGFHKVRVLEVYELLLADLLLLLPA
jgi:hypothetical protein